MGQYLLDSNAFLRAKERPHELRKEARETIEDPANALFVSFASLWEMAIKAANGKLPFYAAPVTRRADGVMRALQESSFELLDIALHHALAAAALPQHHRDPFDRMIIAQAIIEDLTIISSDATFARYAGLRILPA
jgi:PIN domain nuclease of toxin-antitoxin system